MILGREAEREQIGRFLASARDGPSALSLEGSAGIGKTTLWMAGVVAAREAGFRVLTTRAAESEAKLSYAGLGDILEPVLDEGLPTLAEPQRRALEQALLLAGAEHALPDQRAVSLASANLVRTLAATRPLMIAIDDVQWLDAPTARVLSFLIRRLSGEPVGLLVSLRVGRGSKGDPLDTAHAIPHLVRIQIAPLEADVLGPLLRERTGTDIPRPGVLRIHSASHGNPLFALEIARAVMRDGVRWEPGSPLPVPEDLQQLLSARLAALPASSRPVLLAIAAASHPTAELAMAASGRADRAAAGLAKAEQAGVVERADALVRFSHPLLGSTVYANATPGERRALHLRLARLVEDPEERARHLALATDGPDAMVAEELDRAARHARARGAPDAAADLAELARRRTPPEDLDACGRRSLEAAEYHFDAGDAGHALGLLQEAIAALPPGPDRAELFYRRSSMSWMNLVHGVREPAMRALEEAGEDAELRSGILQALAWVAFYLGDLHEALTRARESVECAPDGADPAARADALATLAIIEFVLGHPSDALMSEALRLQDVAMAMSSWTEGSVYTTPRSILGLQLMWAGSLGEARAVFERELAEYEKHAMYTVRQEVLCYLAELECRAGRWQLAARYAAEAMETVVESGQTETQAHVARFNQALAAAYLGQEESARRMANDGALGARANDDAFNESWNGAVLGFLDLSLSNFEEAHEHLAPVVRYLDRMGAAEPGIIPCVPDDIEALVALGRLEEAGALLERFEAQAVASDRPWARAAAGRCRGLMLAAQGHLEDAVATLEAAIDAFERVPQPFELARTFLALGQAERRLKKKRPARDSLDRARGIFGDLGAPLWLDRVDLELARLGGRPSSPQELTPTEEQIARLVAEGRTNREVADALFISSSTVQANLKRVYRKLGVRSRTELATRL